MLTLASLRNFNPRSREGSDIGFVFFVPAWIAISIHAPARGATKYRSDYIAANVNFNPRSREGSDKLPDDARMYYSISIHAPARGATQSLTAH